MIKPDYPSVLLIYTGGTIGMIENPETGALEAFNFDQLQENVPDVGSTTAFPLTSLTLLSTPQTWSRPCGPNWSKSSNITTITSTGS